MTIWFSYIDSAYDEKTFTIDKLSYWDDGLYLLHKNKDFSNMLNDIEEWVPNLKELIKSNFVDETFSLSAYSTIEIDLTEDQSLYLYLKYGITL